MHTIHPSKRVSGDNIEVFNGQMRSQVEFPKFSILDGPVDDITL